MERLSSIIKKYNIGAETIIDFLQVNGFAGQLNLATKLDSKFIELIEKEFNSDKEDKIIANSRKLPETESDKIYNAIKAIGVNQTKRISRYPYRSIFWCCSEINCIDPYIREKPV